MADQEEQVTEKTTVNNGRVVTDRAVTTTSGDYPIAKAGQIVWFFIGAINLLLALRMVLALLGANPANAFADFIYSLSNVFVAPFRGLLQVGTIELGVSRFEVETLVAIIVYALLGWGIVKLLSLGRKDTV